MAYVKPGYWKAGYAVGENGVNVTLTSGQQINTASAGSIQQTHLLSVASSQQVNAASQASVTQMTTHYVITVDSQQVNTSSTGSIQQTHLVTASDSQQANSASGASVASGSGFSGSLSDADIARIAAAVLAAMQGQTFRADVQSVKGNTNIEHWPTATHIATLTNILR